MAFAENLKRARENRSLSQVEVAEELHISQAMVAQYELGMKLPNIVIAVALAELLGTTCEELMYGDIEGSEKNDGKRENRQVS